MKGSAVQCASHWTQLNWFTLTFCWRGYMRPTIYFNSTVAASRLRTTLLPVVWLAMLVANSVWADDYSDVHGLLRAGKVAQAESKAELFLATSPRDAQMRFLKGVILVETGKSTEAMSTFTKLIEDFPDLPEPYNNLAVLYAGQSQFDKARAALELAIRSNPSYATAHENLGDVYTKLANQAYGRALQLDKGNAALQHKLVAKAPQSASE
jgi:tetratricopeptide (TPR) repeat protein